VLLAGLRLGTSGLSCCWCGFAAVDGG